MRAEREVASHIIELERAALQRWANGDPGGFLEISAPDVVYFDPYRERRLDGLDALRALYETLWGQVHLDRFELLDPVIQLCGDVAVLTFNYVSYVGERSTGWNCTEVYRRHADRWLIIQTHWSYTLHGVGR